MPHTAYTDELLRLIRERERFLVTSHARPDGDAIGSSLGMMHLLEAMGKQVDVAFSDPIPVIYQTLPGASRIVSALPSAPPDAAILLECNSVERSGFSTIDAAFVINVDHHLSGQAFGDFNWIDPQCCAVGAMIYTLAVASGVEITPALATCLYTAVLTDTGSFTYASTRASTFALAQHLIERGADAHRVAQDVYFSNPPSKFHLLGAALRTLHVDGELAWAWITQQDIADTGAGVEDCEGVVNYLIGIAGVEAAVFLREQPDGQYRLSLRSKDLINVAHIADSLGGGGHRNASGCTVEGPLPEATASILGRLRTALAESPRATASATLKPAPNLP